MTVTTSIPYYPHKMYYLQSLGLMAATATAAPAFSPLISNETSSAKVYHIAETLDACNAAPNCDTY